jgi:hypothetical protein
LCKKKVASIKVVEQATATVEFWEDPCHLRKFVTGKRWEEEEFSEVASPLLEVLLWRFDKKWSGALYSYRKWEEEVFAAARG